MRRRWIAASVASLLLVVSCGGGSEREELVVPTPTTDLVVEAKEFHFSPPVVAVPAGQDVTVTVINSGTIKHEWVIVAKGHELEDQRNFTENAVLFEVDDVIDGSQRTSTFSIAQAGRYQLICAFEGHFEAGMQASLVVV
jgi:uncharacterized cupredoxin-like copper-binding protein